MKSARNWVGRLMGGMYRPIEGAVSWGDIVLWWESRRFKYNLIVGSIGFICLVMFEIGMSLNGLLQPGEDAEEPMVIFAAPFIINVLYTLGWIVEIAVKVFSSPFPYALPHLGPRLMKLGLGFSLFMVTFPTIMIYPPWTFYIYVVLFLCVVVGRFRS